VGMSLTKVYRLERLRGGALTHHECADEPPLRGVLSDVPDIADGRLLGDAAALVQSVEEKLHARVAQPVNGHPGVSLLFTDEGESREGGRGHNWMGQEGVGRGRGRRWKKGKGGQGRYVLGYPALGCASRASHEQARPLLSSSARRGEEGHISIKLTLFSNRK